MMCIDPFVEPDLIPFSLTAMLPGGIFHQILGNHDEGLIVDYVKGCAPAIQNKIICMLIHERNATLQWLQFAMKANYGLLISTSLLLIYKCQKI